MELFKEGDLVAYEGDMTTLEPRRRNKSFAIIDIKDESFHPFIGIKLLPNYELITVEQRFLRPVDVKEEFLSKLGFETKIIDKQAYFVNGQMVITKYVMMYEPRHYHLTGLISVPSAPYKMDLSKYLNKDNKIDYEKFESDYPQVMTLTKLFQVCQQKRLFSGITVEDFLEKLKD